MGAYEISRDALYLQKATQLADRLMAGFDSSSTGLPQSKINLGTGAASNQRWAGGSSILAEIGSVQLELEYLSFHTGNPVYAQKARSVYSLLDAAHKDVKGLYPTYIDPDTGERLRRGGRQRVTPLLFSLLSARYLPGCPRVSCAVLCCAVCVYVCRALHQRARELRQLRR